MSVSRLSFLKRSGPAPSKNKYMLLVVFINLSLSFVFLKEIWWLFANDFDGSEKCGRGFNKRTSVGEVAFQLHSWRVPAKKQMRNYETKVTALILITIIPIPVSHISTAPIMTTRNTLTLSSSPTAMMMKVMMIIISGDWSLGGSSPMCNPPPIPNATHNDVLQNTAHCTAL